MRLAPPDPNLRISVVVPARNEEALISACLEALAGQQGISPDEYEVILVLDGCTDSTEARARKVSGSFHELRLHFLEGPGKGAGQARHVGMETACARLLELGKPLGLIASTDADTRVEPDWLAAQLELAVRGSQAIGGRIQLDGADGLTKRVADWHSEQGRARHRHLLADSEEGRQAEHWQFSGASMALTAAVYRQIGGLEPRAALEDENLERTLRQTGIPIDRPLSVRVKTSARLVGRASRGLARDLAVASWTEQNTYRAYRADSYVSPPPMNPANVKVSAVVPIPDEVPELEDSVSTLASLVRSGVIHEAVVISGNRELVIPSPVTCFHGTDLMPDFGPIRGRGDVMWRGLSATEGEIVLFLDLTRPGSIPDRVSSLLRPISEREDLEMVRGFRSPPGPLTELVARPFINLHMPHLAGFVDPLYPEFAARRPLLEQMLFPVGRGVDISTLLDASHARGLESLAQVELGSSGPANSASSEEAYALLSAATSRLPGDHLQEDLVPGPLLVPGDGGLGVSRVPLEERPPLSSVRELPSRR